MSFNIKKLKTMNGLDERTSPKTPLNRSSVSNVNINININQMKHPDTYFIVPKSPKKSMNNTDFVDSEIEIKRL
jgi:hypothetical protein